MRRDEREKEERGRPTHGTCVWFKSSYYSCLIGINEFWDMNMYSESLRARTISNSHNFSKLYYGAILEFQTMPEILGLNPVGLSPTRDVSGDPDPK